ncbi:TetR/AcrR family transcriptional regulator [Spelaeicoccus albus]|uniref:AcrR family transcriptional regulator n=1 Tax=Spelaeicoccus albus TaxID=1280376 RepID=A0A7Z0ABN6_9MICO|nr:TetR/AcrR family transcriptional regulator [Spelaeicoccus albus]NYI66890.1 AcrR family transcriptional regulator [Spelaeicoccus albus]
MTTNNAADDKPEREQYRVRRDAIANQERVLAAAVTSMLREGRQVPMATIASEAGVGVGTLYRNYPTRDALLMALTERSFRLVKDAVDKAAATGHSAIDALEAFLEDTISHRDQLVLPLHGGPAELTELSRNLESEVYAGIDKVLERGRSDRTVRADVAAADIVFFGALLAQPLSSDPDQIARELHRQLQIFLAGLTPGPPELENS